MTLLKVFAFFKKSLESFDHMIRIVSIKPIVIHLKCLLKLLFFLIRNLLQIFLIEHRNFRTQRLIDMPDIHNPTTVVSFFKHSHDIFNPILVIFSHKHVLDCDGQIFHQPFLIYVRNVGCFAQSVEGLYHELGEQSINVAKEVRDCLL